ncbi:MAG: P-type DNA transfer ATPase VirB11 [Pseudomonadota bacterium]
MNTLAEFDEPESRDVYLRSFLKPFAAWLDDPDVTEIMINQPGEIWIERSGATKFERVEDPGVSNLLLQRLATQIARVSHQAINREQPLMSSTLPTGERIQFAGPPAAGENWALSIRRHVVSNIALSDFPIAETVFKHRQNDPGATVNEKLSALLNAGRVEDFLRAAVRLRKTILVSGGTSTGKTSLLNALLREIGDAERVITVEDTPEVQLQQPNRLGLLAVKGEMGEARINMNDVLEAALRMRPDRLILGEIRGAEAATYLRAINTGHPGSITTVHADSPEGALDQLALMTMQAGLPLGRQETKDYIKSIVDIIIQVSRIEGKRVIEEIRFEPAQANS